MQVETYEIEETVVGDGIIKPEEVEAEAIGMIETLGLEGQKELLTPKTEDDSTSERVPYPIMSDGENRVYGACFPVHDDVAKYSAGIIPIRVLQVVEHAKPMFEKIEVWHDKVINPDLVLVGVVSYNKYRLLARWGEALVPFEELLQKAQKLLEEKWKRILTRKVKDSQAMLDNLTSEVGAHLASDYVSEPY